MKFDGWLLFQMTYLVATWGNLFAMMRYLYSNPTLAVLLECTYFALACFYWAVTAMFATSAPVLRIFYWIMAVMTGYIASVFWNRWNNRRKRRKGRVAGKVGVRLGRLVIIPEGV